MGHPSLHRSQHRIVKIHRRDAACRVSARTAGSLVSGGRRGEPRLYRMDCAEPFDTLGGYPILLARSVRCDGATPALQPIEEFTPVSGRQWLLRTALRRHHHQRMQHIVQFIRVAHIRPCFLLHLRDGGGIERADFFEYGRRQYAPHFDRPRPALFERRIVQVGIRIRIENLVRELRRHRRVHRQAANPSLLDSAQHFAEAVNIQRLGEHVFHDLGDQWMVGNLDVAFDVLEARRHIGEHRSQQIVGAHALNLRRNFLAALKTQQGQGARRIPPPARLKNRRSQRRLFEDRRHAF